MFGADVSQVPFWDNSRPEEVAQTNTWDYLLPQYTPLSPWPHVSANQKSTVPKDFIMIAEFSEQEGPRPVITIPADGGVEFDQNMFSVRIMSVDHQSSISDNCEMTEDAQVVMSDPDQHAHAFIHHLLLNDIQARGYVRPFCISYVTADPVKVMKCYEELSSQMKMVARLMKYGNRLVFMRDLEKHLEDLSYTKAHLLISQSRHQASSQGDSELLNTLNIIRQSMEEVTNILANLKPLLVDGELEERFQSFERQLRSSRRQTPVDTNSLQDFSNKDPLPELEISGSFTDKEFSLFNKSKNLKPKLLDVSTIRGKRRFDRSLRVLHELCSWGAREGLQRLRSIQECFRRDVSNILMDEMDATILSPDCGILSYGYSTVGANFLSSYNDTCCLKRRLLYVDGAVHHHGHLRSLGSVDSFKSLSSSFQSLRDDDVMYSANSSMIEGSSNFSTLLDRQNSTSSGNRTRNGSDAGQEDGDIFFGHDIESLTTDPPHELERTVRLLSRETSHDLEKTVRDASGSLVETLTYGSTGNDKNIGQPRSLNGSSERKCTVDGFVNIDAEHDLKCSVKGCHCGGAESPVRRRLSAGLIGGRSGSSMSRKSSQQDDTGVYSVAASQLEDLGTNTGTTTGTNTGTNTGTTTGTDTGTGESTGKTPAKEISSMTAGLQDNGDNAQSVELDGEFSENANVGKSTFMEFQGDDDTSSEHCTAVVDDSDMDSTMEAIMTDRTSTLCDNPTAVILDSDNQTDKSDNQCLENKEDTGVNRCQFYVDDDSFNPDVLLSLNADELDGAEKDLRKKGNRNTASLVRTNAEKPESKLSNTASVSRNILHGAIGDNQISPVSDSEAKSMSDSSLNSVEGSTFRSNVENMTKKLSNARLEECVDVTRNPEQRANQYISSTEYSNQPHKHSRRHHWSLLHPLSNVADSHSTALRSIRRLLCSYNNLQHVVYSLLSGRPVVVMGMKKHESCVREFTQALTLFCPVTPGCDAVTLLCQLKQLKVSDVRRFRLRGLIRPDRAQIEFLVPSSVRKYITLVDLDKLLVHGQPYQGTLLHFMSTIFHKKKHFKSDQALFSYVQMCLADISTKAFNFFHCITSGDTDLDFSGTTVLRKSAMLELSANKYLNKTGLLNSDCQIIKHLSEVVKIQQIDEEFKCKYLADSPVYPFGLSYHPLQTYRLQ